VTRETVGILERSEVLGRYRYRLSVAAQEQTCFGRLQEAAAIMPTYRSPEVTQVNETIGPCDGTTGRGTATLRSDVRRDRCCQNITDNQAV
jgi:hypothetical protein